MIVLLALSALFPATATHAQTYPALTGRVVDAAGLLDARTRAAIEEKLAAFEAKSSDQFVVATVPDLQGRSIEDFGVGLGRHWGIGAKKENNGVILLVAKAERKVRIEVGYGLEGTMTDALAAIVVSDEILPAFRKGDYPGGISSGVDAILKILSGDAEEMRARAERNAGWDGSQDFETVLFFVIFFGIWAIVLGSFALSVLRRGAGGRAARRSPWGRTGWTTGSAWGGGSSWGGSSGGGGSSSGGFSGGGGSFGGGGSSGSW